MNCASCGTENRPEARFCDSCGAPLQATKAHEQRKVVTVLFCDVQGSTALGERLDPEALRRVMSAYFETARTAIERHGGTLEKFIGDAVMAVFGVPTVREDDALRAARAAAEIRDAAEIPVRIGVNTGEVVTGGGDSLVTGDAVNVAARLEQAAASGEVLLGAGTYALIRDAVEVELLPPVEAKGKAEPLTAYRLVSVSDGDAVARRGDVPLVGRERERRLLDDAWERVRSGRTCALFTVLGAAGVGKSRLAQEFVADLDATVVRGRCLSYGDGITYWPVVEVVTQLLHDAEPPDGPLAALLGHGYAPADEIAIAVRRLFEQAADDRPLVVVLDDLHWGEPTFLDLVEHVADWSRDAPILLLCLARPELLERRAGWAGGKLNATTVLLEPLSESEADTLIDHLLAGVVLDGALRYRIREAAGGNPLFVEQMLAMAAASAGDVVVPPTIQALLAARLDQLPHAERTALERGAVEGQVFHRGAVQALAPDDPGVAATLLGLVRKELVRPTSATLPGDDAFRFRHLLVRDAAYEALPKSERADLHERFARWIEERGRDLVELDEILGYHLEQAALYRAELGDPSPELARRAALRLGAAGRRAADREDIHAALRLFRRVQALLPADDPDATATAPDFGRVLYASGDIDGAERVLTYATEHAGPDIAATAFFLWAFMRGHARGVSLLELELEVRDALSAYQAHGGSDDIALATGYVTLANVLFWNGRVEEQVRMSERAVAHARLAGHPVLEEWALRQTGAGMGHGSTTWDQFESFVRTVQAELESKGRLTAVDWNFPLASAATYRGRFDEGRQLFAAQAATVLERGRILEHLGSAQSPALLELLAGDYAAAEAILRAAWDGLGERGEVGFRSTTGSALAEALVRLGRIDDALAIAEESKRIGSDDDWVTVTQADYALGMVASARGEHARAVELGRAAVDRADQTEYVTTRMHLWLGYAELLAAAGRAEEAREALQETMRLAALKGSTAYEDRARALLGTLSEPLEEAPR